MASFRQKDVQTPHFSLPLRFDGLNGGTVVNEQDSDEDILDCIKLILAFPEGSREEVPDFGRPDVLFKMRTTDIVARIQKAVVTWEPRADVLITEQPDFFDELVRQVILKLKTRSSG